MPKSNTPHDDPSSIGNKRLSRLWSNVMVMGILFSAVLGSAFMVVHQSFEYRQDYRRFNQLLRDKEELNAEWGRLLIEQQTFGATAQIGSRAVMQLRMYTPPAAQTVVIAHH